MNNACRRQVPDSDQTVPTSFIHQVISEISILLCAWGSATAPCPHPGPAGNTAKGQAPHLGWCSLQHQKGLRGTLQGLKERSLLSGMAEFGWLGVDRQ